MVTHRRTFQCGTTNVFCGCISLWSDKLIGNVITDFPWTDVILVLLILTDQKLANIRVILSIIKYINTFESY